MLIEAQCPNCSHDYNLASKYLGATVRCKNCSTPFTVEEFITEDLSELDPMIEDASDDSFLMDDHDSQGISGAEFDESDDFPEDDLLDQLDDELTADEDIFDETDVADGTVLTDDFDNDVIVLHSFITLVGNCCRIFCIKCLQHDHAPSFERALSFAS